MFSFSFYFNPIVGYLYEKKKRTFIKKKTLKNKLF